MTVDAPQRSTRGTQERSSTGREGSQPAVALDEPDLVMGITPFEEPNARLAIAVQRAGGLGVLDLGRNAERARSALGEVGRWTRDQLGVRVPPGCPLEPGDLPDGIFGTVVLPSGSPWPIEAVGAGRRALVEVTSLAEMQAAVQAGADGVVARGHEAGGRVGDLTTFVLLQQLMAADLGAPVWVAGGIGLHTGAAAIAGGAAGVVLDAQLALVIESGLPPDIAAAVRAMDGSQTAVVGGHRVYMRPDLPVAELAGGDVGGDLGVEPESVALRLGGQDLRSQLLPIGQDGALARPLAERCWGAGDVVRAVRRSIASHLSEAVVTEPLAGGAAFARAHSLQVPVAQGPMTRVSDSPAFAEAVAAAGGLPFLALALMTGDQIRELLERTATLLGDRPWGVGILGFVPSSVRDAQFEAVLDVRPSCALIAGGRPAQVSQLEAAGIEAFLHVPSPGLLDRFLREGARKFVFEGSECGGHVGPRASFPLWETQIERLLTFGVQDGHQRAVGSGTRFFDDVDVLFAGGIHDERSAAMVAALAAPLAARGARVAVLMGTSYLFTDEAVAAGAIVGGFQQAALACDQTVLLETSPGHATRCVDSAYTRAFHDARRRLEERGVSGQALWAELEERNLGRLRVASKGWRRDGDALVPVDEAEQRTEGMFMIGQVAALRSSVTTISELHRQVSEGATQLLAARAAELGATPAAAPGAMPAARPARADTSDVAIVGMACVLPQAGDLARYWANVVSGVDAVTEVPADRWAPGTYYDPDSFTKDAGRRTPSKWGGFLPDVPFDALAYGIPPTSLASIEPVQLLALEVAARALADAGYADRSFDREHTSVIFGAEAGTDLANAYSFRAQFPSYFGPLPAGLDAQLPELTEDSFPGVLSNVIAGRIANRFDLGGVNYTVDAACASSLAALDMACMELLSGRSNVVLCGGADTHNSIQDYLLFAAVHALSPTGRCRPFDGSADGIALGEGVACVVLKRLADAERDGDRIYAVVKGIAGSSDGRSLGLTAPRADGQRRALERAYRMAGVSPAQVGLVEAHGTGTVVGDRTELAVLTELFTQAGADVGSCALGSVKSQIGHTKCTAGMAALIKSAHALYAGVRPPTLHIDEPNRYWERASSPFVFDSAARPWPAPPEQRIAGVSAFGFGGTNFHAVLGGYDGAPEPAHGLDEWPAELFVFRGADREAAAAAVDRLTELCRDNEAAGRPWRLRDLARTVSLEWGTGGEAVRVAVVARDLDDLATKLGRARASEPDPGAGVFVAPDSGTRGKLAFLYPGQGSQRPGMLADLFVAFPRLRRILGLGERWVDTMFPATAFTADERAAQEAALTDTRVAQPALGLAGLALHELLTRLGVQPDMAAGHSYGELVALCGARVLDEAALLDLSQARADAILAAAGDDPGVMAAIAATADQVRAALAGAGADPSVVIANHNQPAQVVISGPTAAMEAALGHLGRQGLSTRRLPVACAFHSPVVAGAASALADRIAQHMVGPPTMPVWSNTTAAPYPNDPDGIRAMVVRQVAEPVRFVEQIETMYDAGARVFVEVGPGRVLTGLVGKILAGQPYVAVACDAPGEHGLQRLLLTLAELAVSGVALDVGPLFHGRQARMVSSTGTPRKAGWVVNGHLMRTADGQHLPGGLRPAAPVALVDGGSANGGITDAGRDARDAAVLEFLRSTRELVTAQRDVLLGYLGSGGFHPPTPVAAVAATVVPADAGPTVTGSNAHGAARTPAQLLQTLLAIVAERTGYPIEMLDPDSDLEADLSIDSIKRTEILGELADRIDLQGAGTDGIDEALAGLKTLRAIVDWIGNHMPAGAAHASRNGLSAITAIADGGEGTVPALPALRRYIVRTEPLPPIPDDQDLKATLEGRSAVIVGGGQSVGMELSTLLASAGVAVLPPGDDSIAGADVVVYLAALDHDHPALPGSYAELRAAVLGAAQWLLIATDVTSAQAPLGAGLRGLARTMALEFPDTVVRAVDVDPGDGPREIAGQLLAELLAPRSPVVVGYRDGTRSTPQVVEAPLHSTRPDADSARAIGLGADSVVLLTGGARGITAEVALGFAGASRCHIELIGRTPASADVEGAADRLPAQRELHATLRKLEAVAASVRYHAVDVRDGQAVAAVVRDVYARHGQLDGVVHGAGIIEDRLLRDKDPASFARVYRTKVDGARALVEALRPDLSFLMLFGSVSGVFGNRGQADYAAANDALDTLSHAWADRFQGRVVAVDWGPWAPAGGGMVSAELERSYTRRGIGMIAPDEGVACLLRELAWGDPALSQVVYMRAPLAAFDRASAVGDPHSPARSPSPSPAAGLAGGSGHG